MRPLMITFLILSPLIALAQNYPLHALPDLTHVQVVHLAHHVAACAGDKMAGMVHAVQEILG